MYHVHTCIFSHTHTHTHTHTPPVQRKPHKEIQVGLLITTWGLRSYYCGNLTHKSPHFKSPHKFNLCIRLCSIRLRAHTKALINFHTELELHVFIQIAWNCRTPEMPTQTWDPQYIIVSNGFNGHASVLLYVHTCNRCGTCIASCIIWLHKIMVWAHYILAVTVC